MNANINNSEGHSEPPEGVLTGDTVPRENEEKGIEEEKIQSLVNNMKAKGEPYIDMAEDRLREKAKEVIREGDE